MKRVSNPVIPDYRSKSERTKVEELPLQTCLICKKKTQGYGTFHEGVVCSHKCNDSFMASRPSLIDYQTGVKNEISDDDVGDVLPDGSDESQSRN